MAELGRSSSPSIPRTAGGAPITGHTIAPSSSITAPATEPGISSPAGNHAAPPTCAAGHRTSATSSSSTMTGLDGRSSSPKRQLDGTTGAGVVNTGAENSSSSNSLTDAMTSVTSACFVDVAKVVVPVTLLVAAANPPSSPVNEHALPVLVCQPVFGAPVPLGPALPVIVQLLNALSSFELATRGMKRQFASVELAAVDVTAVVAVLTMLFVIT